MYPYCNYGSVLLRLFILVITITVTIIIIIIMFVCFLLSCLDLLG